MCRGINFFRLLFVGAVFASMPLVLFAHDWNAPEEAVRRSNPVPEDAASIERGHKLYEQFCANCHGKNGQGDGPLAAALKPKPPNLEARAEHHTDGDFAWKIANGRGVMPGFKDQLTENQIWDLTHFIQNLKK